jgi:PAS domain S-box-containing protein
MSKFSKDVNLIWFELDNNSCFSRINKSTQLLLETNEEKLIGKSFDKIFTSYNLELLKARITELKAGTIDSFSISLILLNSGKRVTVGIYISDLFDGQKRIIGAFQISIEEQLYPENSKKLLVQLNYTKEAIAIRNNKGEFFFVNKSLMDVFGYSSSKELLGKPWTILHFEEDIENINNTVINNLNKTGNYRGELRGKRKNNSLIYLEISLTQLDNGDLLCLLKDISNKKTQEQELEKLGMVLEKTNSQVLMLNKNGNVEWANEGYYRNSGYTTEEVIGKNIQVIGRGELTSVSSRIEISKSLENGNPYRGEQYQYKKNGIGYWMYVDITPAKNSFQEIEGFVVVQNDISSIKEAERNILQTLDKERSLSNLKTQFIQLASHEFRTPLASIQSSIDILDLSFIQNTDPKDPLKKTFDRHHKRITHEIRRMSDIMSNILLLGRFDAGKMVYNPIEADFLHFVNELIVEETYGNYSPRTVSHEIRGNPRKIEMDVSMMRYIFKNLLSNAFKYSINKPDPIMIVRFLEESIVIEIKDYGIGVPEAEAPNLFTSFFRCSNAEAIPGTGLGLVIVKQLTEMHQGKVSLTSTITKGSTFKLEFPYKQIKL